VLPRAAIEPPVKVINSNPDAAWREPQHQRTFAAAYGTPERRDTNASYPCRLRQ
jgi:hypothetical protein